MSIKRDGSREEPTNPPTESAEPRASNEVESDGSVRRRDPPSAASPVEEQRHEEKPRKKNGRPHNRWRIRVVRIDAARYPQFAGDKDHPFAKLTVDARLEEIDSFFARLTARKKTPRPPSGDSSAAA